MIGRGSTLWGNAAVGLWCAAAVAGLYAGTSTAAAAGLEPGSTRQGEVEFTVGPGEQDRPEHFRLTAHRFPFEQQFEQTSQQGIALSLVTFPSPVETPVAANNTVHCEYFCPDRAEPGPATIVLHILGGDFDLARLFCRHLAANGVAALFLKMPYYGPRRDPASDARMVSADPRQTAAGMRQAVLDIRRASAWLAAQEEVDPQRLGVFGISLGGITAALAATAEPRLHNVCLMLAGGDISQVAWESQELAPLREHWLAQGETRESFFEVLESVDPAAYAPQALDRRVLMLNASRDEVIPPECTKSLWRAWGEPPIVWYNAGHYSAVFYLLDGLGRVTGFFQNAERKPAG